MLRRYNLGTLVALACLAELLTFIAVVDWIGFGPALLLGFGATLLGLARLRRLGTAAFGRLRDVAVGRVAREDAFIDGALGTIGAVLLVLPGFLTDIVGLALLAPSCREWVKGYVGFTASPLGAPRGAGRTAGPRTSAPDTDDFTRLDRARPN